MKSWVQNTERDAIAAAAARWVARHDAGLTPEEQGQFQNWLSADSRHASAVAHFSATWSVLDRVGRAGATAGVLRQIASRAQRRRCRGILAAVGMAAASVLTLTLWQERDGSEREMESVPRAALLTPQGRTLADGSIVQLNPQAEILVSFTDAARRVVLKRGAAHFQVAKIAGRPFIVETRGFEVMAVGTAFAVQLETSTVEILVTEGQVAVGSMAPGRPTGTASSTTTFSSPDAVPETRTGKLAPPPGVSNAETRKPAQSTAVAATNPQSDVTLGAGNGIVIEMTQSVTNPKITRLAGAEIERRLAWRTPRIEFSSMPLAEAVALMNRVAESRAGADGLRLVIDPASPGLAREPVSGLFSADNVEAFARLLELSLRVKAERRGEREIVLRGID